MEFVEFGNKDGRLVVYFHGAPGSIKGSSVFDRYAMDNNLKFVCLDRFSIDISIDRESYYQKLADQINVLANGEPVDIIGFSIGAHVAIEVGRLLDGQVRQIHLISSAAPINAGDFIGQMAGGLVFKLAMERPSIFSLLTQYQKALAYLAPGILVYMLFASSAGKDKELSKQHNFRRYITPVLEDCFKNRASGYMRDVKFYVSWPDDLKSCTNIVYIWHGTDDNWSPLSMASYLNSAIPGATGVQAMEGLSHYSCLYEAAPKICAQLAKS